MKLKKRGNMHPVGCNELGVGRSLKLSDLQACPLRDSSFLLGWAKEGRGIVKVSGKKSKIKKKLWEAEEKRNGVVRLNAWGTLAAGDNIWTRAADASVY